jgi:RimJ/RimL family protein N-acetyltransferase
MRDKEEVGAVAKNKIKLLEAHEIPELFKIISDQDIAKHLVADPTVITESNLAAFLLTTDPGTTATAYSIYSREGLVGVVTLNNISLIKKSAFVGVIAIKQTVKDKGFGLNAVKWLLKHSFDTLGLNRVYSHTWSDNKRMDAFYKHLGIFYEGTEREHTWKQGKFVDMKIWSILRREYYGTTS